MLETCVTLMLPIKFISQIGLEIALQEVPAFIDNINPYRKLKP